jgi:hypothetical protein
MTGIVNGETPRFFNIWTEHSFTNNNSIDIVERNTTTKTCVASPPLRKKKAQAFEEQILVHHVENDNGPVDNGVSIATRNTKFKSL